jgi:hypothetical protein
MTQYQRHRLNRSDDPADELVDAYLGSISEELGTDGPAETFGHPDESLVGHLIEDGYLPGEHKHTDTMAFDTHDVEDLAAEELAMHIVDEDTQTRADQDDLPGYLR